MSWLAQWGPSLALTAWSLMVMTVVGRKKRAGWVLGVLAQLWWAAYAIWLHQWGLLFSCPLYAAIYIRNWFRWRPTP